MSNYIDTTGLARQGGIAASAVEAELQRYVEEKGVNDLFINITEHMLMAKPDNPVQFIIDFLRERYPDQVAAPHSGFDGGAEAKYDPSAARGGGGAAADEDEDEDDSEDEDDDDDYVDELPRLSPAQAAGRRRTAVSAEPGLRPESLDGVLRDAAVPKDPEATARICDWLRRNLLFHHLADAELEAVAGAFRPREYKEGDALIRQGARGEEFFLLDAGECEVFVSRAVSQALAGGEAAPEDAGDGELALRCRAGDTFGELALLYNAPRAATVRAATDVSTWVLERRAFKAIMVHSAAETHRKHLDFVSRISLLSELTGGERQTIADALQPEFFKSGTVIVRQGEPGHKFYILEEGEAAVSKRITPAHPPKQILTLGSGGYFGEVALLTAKPRQASVTALSDCVCLSLDRKTFIRVAGPLAEILKRNMDKYTLVMGQQV